MKEMVVKRYERDKVSVSGERSILMPMFFPRQWSKGVYRLSTLNELLTKSLQFSSFRVDDKSASYPS